ncbi:MAG: 50S ribosomal protein L29 [Bacteroidales bacterium]|jgi:large subunit ribosomal protein L29|nr:50S ribosomal protein L29 [Bacteroidota bacterium]MBQ9509308.1 50S ribosomal protein L29 [Bacteroidales bacterium]MBR6063754.1 50S ribosomal protein L29 [Bacteroidales bacterium]
MKQQVIRELSTPEVKERLVEEKQQLVKLKLNHAVSPIENPQKIKEQRKTVARLMTELRMRELKENVK